MQICKAHCSCPSHQKPPLYTKTVTESWHWQKISDTEKNLTLWKFCHWNKTDIEDCLWKTHQYLNIQMKKENIWISGFYFLLQFISVLKNCFTANLTFSDINVSNASVYFVSSGFVVIDTLYFPCQNSLSLFWLHSP